MKMTDEELHHRQVHRQITAIFLPNRIARTGFKYCSIFAPYFGLLTLSTVFVHRHILHVFTFWNGQILHLDYYWNFIGIIVDFLFIEHFIPYKFSDIRRSLMRMFALPSAAIFQTGSLRSAPRQKTYAHFPAGRTHHPLTAFRDKKRQAAGREQALSVCLSLFLYIAKRCAYCAYFVTITIRWATFDLCPSESVT